MSVKEAVSPGSPTTPRSLAGRTVPARAKIRTHARYSPWLFLAPALLASMVFVLYPFAKTIFLAFTNTRPLVGGEFVGLQNFRTLFNDPMFLTAFGNSLLYVVCVVPLLVILPLLLAMLVQKNVPGIGIFRTIAFIPVIASVVVTGLIWTWMLDSRGLVNSVLETLGAITEPIPFLTNSTLLLFSAMLVTVWQGLGYYMIIYLAMLANVPKDLHEAAALDGAGVVRRFFTVTVPAMRQTMVVVGIVSSLAAFRVFAEIYVLSGGTGGPGGNASSLVMMIRESGTGLSARLGYSSAISLVLFLLTVGLLTLNLWLTRKKEDD